MSGALIASTLASLLTAPAQFVAARNIPQGDVMTPPSGAQVGDLGVLFVTSASGTPTSGWTQRTDGSGLYVSFKVLTQAELSTTQTAAINRYGYVVYRFSPTAAFGGGNGFAKDTNYNGALFIAVNASDAKPGTIKRLTTTSGASLYDVISPSIYQDNTGYGTNIAIELHLT